MLDEAAWDETWSMELKFEVEPGENTPAPVRTEVMLTYSDRDLLLAFRCYDPEPEKIRARIRDRDQLWGDDFVGIMLDTFNDERRAFQFRVNPLGVQADAIFSEVDGIEDWSWDMIWTSRGRITSDGYEVEILKGGDAVTVVNQAREQDLEQRHPVATLQLAGQSLIEMDEIAGSEDTGNGITAGMACVTFHCSGPPGEEARLLASGPFAGHPVSACTGTAGERFALIHP